MSVWDEQTDPHGTKQGPPRRYGRRVYVAGPMSKGAWMQNVRKGIDAAEELLQAGLLPFVPHMSSFHDLIYPHDYEDWLEQDFAWVEACHALLRLPGESGGADREVEHARKYQIPVFYSVQDVVRWSQKT